MKLISYPLNGITYDAQDVGTYLCTRTSGVYSRETNFAVSVTGAREITVSPGLAWINYDDFKGISVCARESGTLTIPDADDIFARIDRVVLQFDSDANRTTLKLKTGTPEESPAAPEIQQNHRVYELCIAEISVPAGSTSVTAADITDTRLDESLCGVMRDGVEGIPTGELLAQAKARIGSLEEQATGSAEQADQSAAAAADSERAATAAAGTATTKAAAANGSAEQAAASEANAKASEETAVKKAGEANTSASAAARSQQDAAAFKQAAATSEANAKAAADRAALIAANAYVYAYDLTLSKDAWAAATEADATAAGLAYQYDYAIADCTERLEPSATVSMASTAAAQKCGLGVVCRSMAGACRFYAATVPESDIALRLLLTNRNPNQEG